MPKSPFEQPSKYEAIQQHLEEQGVRSPQEWRKAIFEKTPARRERRMKIPDYATDIYKAFSELDRQKEKLEEGKLYPRVGVLGDSGQIENQQIDIIKATKNQQQKYKVWFKLTRKQYDAVRERLESAPEIETSYIQFREDESGYGYQFATAWELSQENAKIRISNDPEIRSAYGQVEIEIPVSEFSDQENLRWEIENALQDILNIKEPFVTPDEEAESLYKSARYRWHHKLGDSDPMPHDIDSRLAREEVFSNYYTMVEHDKHSEYQALSPYAVYHTVYSIYHLPQILRGGV